MFGSQALETLIGLTAMFFIVATAASSITEVISRMFGKRAADLEKNIAALLKGEAADADITTVLGWFKETSVWASANAAAGKSHVPWKGRWAASRTPSYLSAKTFADAVSEMLLIHPLQPDPAPADTRLPLPGKTNLEKRLRAMNAEGRDDLLSLKAGLEGWFDETMARAEGAYKRWATATLFAVGLLLAVALNLSTITVASTLWHDPVTRDAVANSSAKLLRDGASGESLTTVAKTADELQQLNIPGGWNSESRSALRTPLGFLADVGGWLLTAVLVMLGAPFWFDLLGKIVALRGVGAKPALAADDGSSATSVATEAVKSPTLSQPGVVPAKVASSPAGPADTKFAAAIGLKTDDTTG